jgi:hypothetical protein
MSSATATATISSKPSSLPRWLGGLALTVVIVVAGIVGNAILAGPRLISRVTVVNPSPYAVEIEVSDPGGHAWLRLGSTPPKSAARVDDVIDQGPEWVFRVRAQGVSGGEFVVDRDQLARSRWRVTVPSSVIARLESQDIPASPARS